MPLRSLKSLKLLLKVLHPMFKICDADKIPLGRNVNLKKSGQWGTIVYFMEQYVKTIGLAGLHAVQLGLPKNIFVCGNETYVNCQYLSISGEYISSIEGCHSLPGQLYKVQRFKKIRVIGHKYISSRRSIVEVDEIHNVNDPAVEGMPSKCIVFQHEIDHGNQGLIRDIGVLHGA